jgi:hypothetical protein
VIRVTGEHPFYVANHGWRGARELQPGDLLRSHDGQWVPVEEVIDNGEESVVYNVRVSNYGTYFVGDVEWGFSVWAHNACSRAVAEAIEQGIVNVQRTRAPQIHHIASVTSRLTPRFREMFRRAGLSLESAWNKTRVTGHVGPHGWYNSYVLQRLRNAVAGKNGPAYTSALLDELWQLRREIQNGTLGNLLRAPGS